ncbi:hypothetical protein AFL01nite_27090 [Aeromicrobium flavum]|uniref:Uncharacterized protein n=1 Tax=Aeromicrobium flavum TaxID=416568 RepID=A0A512HY67_9ACTN|nr:hypothetical protein [Aeromicrobium flavum]GEO90382.1 hypothetical protein AFL01nite_27090 [Aeromicrobium flavum]
MSISVASAVSRLRVEPGPLPHLGQVGRLYVLTTDQVAAVLDDLGPQAHVVTHDGLLSHIVRGTTRPAGWWRLPGHRRHVPCGDVERTDVSLVNGIAHLDHELGTDRVLVRTWAPRDGSELDQILWWQGHPVAARLHPRG